MTRKSDLDATTGAIARTVFNTRRGYVVPTTDTVALSNGGVYVDAVYLYADMADSSGMARLFTRENAARIIRAYLDAVTRVLKYHGGEIRSFDGDRVMAIYIGEDAASKAARAALEAKWVVDNVVSTQLSTNMSAYAAASWTVSSRTGIDTGPAFIVRGGVRNSNDLVSIGDAPNIAAKLSDLKLGRTMITDQVWQAMSYNTCFSGSGASAKAIWTQPETRVVGGRSLAVRHSNWGWELG